MKILLLRNGRVFDLTASLFSSLTKSKLSIVLRILSYDIIPIHTPNVFFTLKSVAGVAGRNKSKGGTKRKELERCFGKDNVANPRDICPCFPLEDRTNFYYTVLKKIVIVEHSY